MREDVKEIIKLIKMGIIPCGYKKTKCGVLPVDWPIVDFGKIFKINQGLQIPISERFLEKGKNRYYYITNQFIKNLNTEGEKYYIEAPSQSVICCEDDVLMTRTGNTGMVVTNVNGVFHNNFFKISFDRSKYDKNFIVHYLMSSYCQNIIMKFAGTSTIPDLNHGDFYKIKFVNIQRAEQQKIAKILSSWDKAIELKEQLIEEKKKQKKGLMQKLLTSEVRLLGFDEKWEKVLLKDIFKRVTRKNTIGNTNVLTISAQKGLINQKDFFKKSVASSILDNYYLLRKGEFAYNKSYSNGYPKGAIKRLNHYDSGVVTTLYICFKLIDSSENNAEYFEHYFESGLLNQAITKIAHEGGRAHGLLNVSSEDFFNLPIQIPSYKTQVKIAEILTCADRERQLLEQELEALKIQKKGLMQLLLTGIVRVMC
ncbi:restriction endonuclease subunit S [Desulfuribacillus alkaliarsenatis]|nr:restriction endonuclease subunit S [Desulfuribacillus alkaliarsenatis]